jgi:exonuclease VII small subunit
MGVYAPPYLNKNVERLEKELALAEKKEQVAKENYETAVEYTKLCREALDNAQDN